MEQGYPNHTRRVKKPVVIFHYHGPRAIFILFCNYRDSESESWDMKVVVAAPILIGKISKALWDNDIHTV